MATHIETTRDRLVSVELQDIDGQSWVRLTITHRDSGASALLNPAEAERLVAALAASQRPEQAGGVKRLEAALDRAGKDFVAGHAHIAERLHETDYLWLMHHLEAAFGRVCDAALAQPAGAEPSGRCSDVSSKGGPCYFPTVTGSARCAYHTVTHADHDR